MSFVADEFEENLLKSIDTLLDERSSRPVEHIQDGVVCEVDDVWPAVVPKYTEGNCLLIDGQNYVKWSTVESDEQLWPKKPPTPPVTMDPPAASNIGKPSMVQQQSQYIAAAMTHTQQILNQYQNLLYQYNLIRNGPMPNLVDRLLYSINPNYAGIGNLLAASAALNWNATATANYGNQISLANQLNGLLLRQKRGVRGGKHHPNNVHSPKKQWPAAATNKW